MTNNNPEKKLPPRDCDHCTFFVYDEEAEENVCDYNFDEDEMENFLSSGNDKCPFFLLYDEYKTVRKQN